MLRKKLYRLTVLSLLSFATPAYSAIFDDLGWKLQLGLEAGRRDIHWAEGFGKDHFAKTLYQISPFMQIQLNDYFAFKFAYDTTNMTYSFKQYKENDFILNAEAYFPVGVATTVKVKGYRGQILFYPLAFDQEKYKIQPFFTTGFSKSIVRLTQIEDDLAGVARAARTLIPLKQFRLSSHKNHILGVGLQYQMSDHVIATLSYIKEKLKNISYQHTITMANHPLETSTLSIKANKSTHLLFGLSYIF